MKDFSKKRPILLAAVVATFFLLATLSFIPIQVRDSEPIFPLEKSGQKRLLCDLCGLCERSGFVSHRALRGTELLKKTKKDNKDFHDEATGLTH